MKRPRRNIPISTVIVAATVVERFAPMERNASLKKSLALGICLFRRVLAAALVADDVAVVERDHTLAHLVDHLAVVGRHDYRRARCG